MKRLIEARKNLQKVVKTLEEEYDVEILGDVYGAQIQEIHLFQGIDALYRLAAKLGVENIDVSSYTGIEYDEFFFVHNGIKYFALVQKE